MLSIISIFVLQIFFTTNGFIHDLVLPPVFVEKTLAKPMCVLGNVHIVNFILQLQQQTTIVFWHRTSTRSYLKMHF